MATELEQRVKRSIDELGQGVLRGFDLLEKKLGDIFQRREQAMQRVADQAHTEVSAAQQELHAAQNDAAATLKSAKEIARDIDSTQQHYFPELPAHEHPKGEPAAGIAVEPEKAPEAKGGQTPTL